MTPTLPSRLVARLAAGILESEARQLENRANRNPRGVQADTAEARRRVAAKFRAQAQTIRGMQVELAGKTTDAVTAALLLAWVGGHGEILRALEDHLVAIKHPSATAIQDVDGHDIAEGCRLVLAAPRQSEHDIPPDCRRRGEDD